MIDKGHYLYGNVIERKGKMYSTLFTSESVSQGHPDKICDQISDSILDYCLEVNKDSRVAIETMIKDNLCIVAGEVKIPAYIGDLEEEFKRIALDVLKNRVYMENLPIDKRDFEVQTIISKQSDDIAMGVDGVASEKCTNKRIGAGDQGMMFGFACTETSELMPLPLVLAHKLVRKLDEQRRGQVILGIGHDAKSQVTVRYDHGKPVAIDAIVISVQHHSTKDLEELKEEIEKYVIGQVFKGMSVVPDRDTKILVNPTGRFVTGGPFGDSGLTGRKIIVDTYGGYARHGGGAFSGKDPTKVDRSGAYMARYIAKNLVASGVATKCEVQLAYAIGVPEPVSVYVDTFGTGFVKDAKLVELIRSNFELNPNGMIDKLGLLNTLYEPTATYGHFGRSDLDLPWERIDMVDVLRRL